MLPCSFTVEHVAVSPQEQRAQHKRGEIPSDPMDIASGAGVQPSDLFVQLGASPALSPLAIAILRSCKTAASTSSPRVLLVPDHCALCITMASLAIAMLQVFQDCRVHIIGSSIACPRPHCALWITLASLAIAMLQVFQDCHVTSIGSSTACPRPHCSLCITMASLAIAMLQVFQYCRVHIIGSSTACPRPHCALCTTLASLAIAMLQVLQDCRVHIIGSSIACLRPVALCTALKKPFDCWCDCRPRSEAGGGGRLLLAAHACCCHALLQGP